MFFANPIALFGLLALAIPILLHLERRRITRRLPFAFVDFLFEAQKHRFWSLKMQQLLLLFLRLLLIALVVLALAQLNVRMGAAGQWLGLLGGAPRSGVVLLVDVSPSMNAGESGRSRLEAARELGQALLSTMDNRSEILLMPFAEGPVGDLHLFSRSRARARQELAELTTAGRDTLLLESAEAAARRLTDYAAGTVFILSDFAPRPTEALARGAAALLERHPSVAFVLVPVPSLGRGNLAVGEVVLSRLPLLAGETGEVGLALANYGNLDTPGLFERWTVEDATSAGREVRFQPPPEARGVVAQHRFLLAAPHNPQATEVRAHFRLEVEEGYDYADALPGDNEVTILAPVLAKPRIRVLGEEAEGLGMRAYRALLSGGETAPIAASAEFIPPASLADGRAPVELLVLLEGPSGWSDGEVRAIHEHLRGGGGLLLFSAARGGGRLLPTLGVEAEGPVESASLSLAPPSDPFGLELAETAPELWERIEALGAPGLAGLDHAWLRTSGGALVAGRKAVLGGQVVVCSVGLELADSNFAVSPLFVFFNQLAFKALLDPELARAPEVERLAAVRESDISPCGPELLEELKGRGFGLLSASPDALSAAPFDTGRFRSLTGLLLWLALLLAGVETWLANRV